MAYLSDGSGTCGAFGGEECVVIHIAIRQTILFTIAICTQRFVTLDTRETVGMPGLAQRLKNFLLIRQIQDTCNAFIILINYISDWKFASVTLGKKHLLKVFIAIRLSVLFFEVVWAQRYCALIALETVRVPLTTHRYQWLFKNEWFNTYLVCY